MVVVIRWAHYVCANCGLAWKEQDVERKGRRGRCPRCDTPAGAQDFLGTTDDTYPRA